MEYDRLPLTDDSSAEFVKMLAKRTISDKVL